MRTDPIREPAATLRAHGLRVTKQRISVMSALADRPHSGADAVLAAVRADVGQVSTQAVYDVLNTLTDRGIVRRIQPAGSSARYELRVGDNHHHLVCRGCGTVVDVDCATRTAPCLDTSRPRRPRTGLRRRRGRGDLLGALRHMFHGYDGHLTAVPPPDRAAHQEERA